MSVRGRRSESWWCTCESCHVVLCRKDVSVHQETSCPPTPGNCPYGFVTRAGVLHGFLEELSSADELGCVPRSERRHVVLLPTPLMQLCGVAIGDAVLVTCGGVAVVMTTWPAADKSAFVVHVLSSTMELHWGCSRKPVTVHSLQEVPNVAAEVAVSCSGQSHPPSHFASLLRALYSDKVVCVGSQLSVPNYGRDLHFRVERLLPLGGQVPAQHEEENTPSLWWKVLAATKWRLEGKGEDEGGGAGGKPAGCRAALEDVGGLQPIIAELKEMMDACLWTGTVVQGMQLPRAVLLYGPAGVGKTLLAEALAVHSGAFVARLGAAEALAKAPSELVGWLQEVSEAVRVHAPSMLLLDDVDALCPAPAARLSEHDRRLTSGLLTLLDELRQQSEPVMVVATTSRPDQLHPALRRPGRLDQELEVGVPTPEARHDILRRLLVGPWHQLVSEDVSWLACSTHGFVGADLASLCANAGRRATCAARLATVEDFACALRLVKPSAMREMLVQVPNVKWCDVGGQHDLKLRLRQAVEWPLCHPQVFSRLGISAPTGILMFGPPGCSKTMIAKALATESGLNFLSIKGPELFSKWVGESERAVREVFRRARQVAPAIVFFDELDAMGGERASAQSQGSNVQERVLAQLLTEMDGIESLGNVVIVGATNRPDRIDKALLRPGRLDRMVYVPLPDEDTRREILALQLRRMPVAEGVDTEELVHRTHGYSGAEVVALCSEAALKALEEDMSADMVQRSHFLSALTVVTPRTPSSLLQLYRDYCSH